MKEDGVSPEDALSFSVEPTRLAGLLRLLEEGKVSAASAKELLAAMRSDPREAAQIAEEKGLGRIADASALEGIVAEIVAANSSQAELYRGGKTAVLGWFFGQVMKKTGGRADPALVREALTKALGEPPA
jgi:aspartyl-tRNA(Asn)/glutamyl-tRNA(Gln) amidotransferase subunit B